MLVKIESEVIMIYVLHLTITFLSRYCSTPIGLNFGIFTGDLFHTAKMMSTFDTALQEFVDDTPVNVNYYTFIWSAAV